jgi:hypothetical protein
MSRIDRSRYMTQPFARRTSLWLLSVALAGAAPFVLAPLDAAAADPVSVQSAQPLRDPWVPPESRKPSTTAPTEGAALRAQAEHKLKQAFDAADVSHTGSLTLRPASAAGLGFVAKHFDEIDQQKTGAVRFDDVKRFLVARGAQLD